MRVSGLIDAISAPVSLKWRAIQTGLLEIMFSGIAMPVRLLTNLLLVQFLAPNAFGLMATVTLVHVFLGLISDVGLAQSIIREKDGERPEFLCIAWTVKVIRSFVLTGITISAGVFLYLFQNEITSPGTIYADPLLPGLLILSSLPILFNGFGSINGLLAKRRLKALQVVKLNFVAMIVSSFTMIVLSSATESVWALLSGMILSAGVYGVCSHFWLDGPRMRFVFDRSEMARLWVFGRWVILSSTFGFVLRNSDRIVLSLNASASVFSLYAIAFSWVDAVRSLLVKLSDAVVFPVTGEMIREGRTDLRAKIEKIFLFQLIVAVAMILLLPIIVIYIIISFFPSEFHGSIEYIPIICLAIYSLPITCYAMILNTTGKSKIVGVSTAISSIVIITLMWVVLNEFGVKYAILLYSTAPLLNSQLMFFGGRLWRILGWRTNGLWVLGLLILSYAHLTWYVL